MATDYDIIVVGGGIAGGAMAATMAEAGYKVLLLEKSTAYADGVRGEWISNWGVQEVKRLGLYDLLLNSGGHHIRRHIRYDEMCSAETANAAALPLDMFIEDVPGPLGIGHPVHCQALLDEAGRCGAEVWRGVTVAAITPTPVPGVTFAIGGQQRTASARLIVGATGRSSLVRRAAGIRLFQDKPHHWFAGLLVRDATGWDPSVQAIGTEGDMGFLIFPQGKGIIRIYAGCPLSETKRFAGADAAERFLAAFHFDCAPETRHIANGAVAGPLMRFHNNDSWTTQPFSPGVVLIGDQAGWNDPILGQGLSVSYRDVRIVSDLLKESSDWSERALQPYAVERAERMRRLRFTARLQARIDMEFDAPARQRRKRYLDHALRDPGWARHLQAVMAGPETVDPEAFTNAFAAEILGESPIEMAVYDD